MEYIISDRMSRVQGSIIREIFKAAADPEVISLAGGNPAPETFPSRELERIAKFLLEENPALALQYGISEGYEPLRIKIREMLKESENIESDKDEILITSGGTQCMDFCGKVLLNEGDVVIVEEPSFIGTLNTFRGYNAKLVGVPMDEDGMNIDALKNAIAENENVKLIYTIPTFQNPSGITMSLEKRKALYEVARDNNILILEDNPYGELIFDGEKVPTLKSIDKDGVVIYASSFSKILSPGMRLGYMFMPKELMGKMTIAKQMGDVHTNMLAQTMAYEFMKTYNIYNYIDKSRALYRRKCKWMLKCMDKYFPEEVTWTKPNGGLFIWATMPPELDAMEVSKICAKEKVAFVPGNAFMVDMNAPSNSFRLNYSTMSDEKIEKGIQILGTTLKRIIEDKCK